jgi:hypothetical protein
LADTTNYKSTFEDYKRLVKGDIISLEGRELIIHDVQLIPSGNREFVSIVTDKGHFYVGSDELRLKTFLKTGHILLPKQKEIGVRDES